MQMPFANPRFAPADEPTTPEATALADAIGTLLSSLKGPVERHPAYVEAMMDHTDYEERPSITTAHVMSKSAEDLLDTLSAGKHPESPERQAAEAALVAYVRS